MKKKKYHHGNLKETYLKIAFAFIEKHDIEKLTLKVLSDIAGTSRSAIYSHFDSKDALIEAMILSGFVKFDEHLSRSFQDNTIPLVSRIEKASRDYIAFAKANKVLYRLLFGNKYARIRMEAMTKNGTDRTGFGLLVDTIEKAQKDGVFKADDPNKQAIVIWSSLHGLSSLIIDGFVGIDKMYDELFASIFTNLMSGLRLG